jgi:hypothetical protein
MKNQKKSFDVEALMKILVEADKMVESGLSEDERAAVAAMRKRVEENEPLFYAAGGEDAKAAEDFELLASADALESLAAKVRAAVAIKEEKIYQHALEVFYAMEEQAKDPANAHLVEQVQKMREAHQRSYGKPVPPKKK